MPSVVSRSLERAVARAAVARLRVAVVALLAGLEVSVTAGRHPRDIEQVLAVPALELASIKQDQLDLRFVLARIEREEQIRERRLEQLERNGQPVEADP